MCKEELGCSLEYGRLERKLFNFLASLFAGFGLHEKSIEGGRRGINTLSHLFSLLNAYHTIVFLSNS